MMSDFSLNQQVIAEFRANGGRVGGYLEGALVVLVHHRGRLSGSEYAHPVVYLADADDHGPAGHVDPERHLHGQVLLLGCRQRTRCSGTSRKHAPDIR